MKSLDFLKYNLFIFDIKIIVEPINKLNLTLYHFMLPKMLMHLHLFLPIHNLLSQYQLEVIFLQQRNNHAI